MFKFRHFNHFLYSNSSLSLLAFLALNGDLTTDANGNRYLVDSKGNDIPSTTGGATKGGGNDLSQNLTIRNYDSTIGNGRTIEFDYLKGQTNYTQRQFISISSSDIFITNNSDWLALWDTTAGGYVNLYELKSIPEKFSVEYDGTIAKLYVNNIYKGQVDSAITGNTGRNLLILGQYNFDYGQVSNLISLPYLRTEVDKQYAVDEPEKYLNAIKDNGVFPPANKIITHVSDTVILGTGNTYYVDINNGSDSNNGDIGTPFKNIYYATKQLYKGDTLYVRGGTYPTEVGDAKSIVFSGNAQNGTTASDTVSIIAYQSEEVIIDGSNLTNPSNLTLLGVMQPYHVTYLNIINIKIQNSVNSLLYVLGASGKLLIQNVKTYHSIASGIYVDGSSGIIEDCEVYDATQLGWQESMSLYACDNLEVRYNEVHHNGNTNQHNDGLGIDFKSGCTNSSAHHNFVHHMDTHGIYIDARNDSYNLSIYENRVEDCSNRAICISDEGTTTSGKLHEVYTYSNIVARCHMGITVGYTNLAPNQIYNVWILHNTITDCDYQGIYIDVPPAGLQDEIEAHDINVANNITYGNLKVGGASEIQVSAGSPSGCAIINNNSEVNPLFISSSDSSRYEVTKTSPCYNAKDNAYNGSIDVNHNNIGARGSLFADLCMPLNETGSTRHEYISNTDISIANYTTDCDIQGLSTGLQKITFNADMLYTVEQMNFYAGDNPIYVQDLSNPLSIKETLKDGTVYLWTYDGTIQKLYKNNVEQTNETVTEINVGEISRLNGEAVAEVDTFELFNGIVQ